MSWKDRIKFSKRKSRKELEEWISELENRIEYAVGIGDDLHDITLMMMALSGMSKKALENYLKEKRESAEEVKKIKMAAHKKIKEEIKR